MTLLGETGRYLEHRAISFAVIGATALSVHGIARSTADIDLLLIDRSVLKRDFWSSFTAAEPDLRVGDMEDPLAGVVRLRDRAARALDLIVAKHRFAAAILTRAEPRFVSGESVTVVTLADLVLLKLFAGGPQDAWDIEQALITGGPAVRDAVDVLVSELPADARALWRRIRR